MAMKARNKHAINPLMARCVAHGKSRKAQRAQEKLATRKAAKGIHESAPEKLPRFFAMLENEEICLIPGAMTFDDADEACPEATQWIFDEASLAVLIETGEAVRDSAEGGAIEYVGLCGETVVPIANAATMLDALDRQPGDCHWVMQRSAMIRLVASARAGLGM